MTQTLIICIGNVARGDDGVAHSVATRLGDATLPSGCRVITAVGLDVAMATDVADVGLLIVVDAERRSEPAVAVSPLEPGTSAHSGHGIDAPGLLAVTRALYGTLPDAVLVSVAAPAMGHGEGLSRTAEAASEEAASAVLELLNTTQATD